MPTFYVFNTYGFGNNSNPENQNNKNNTMSQDNNAGNPSNENTGSIATITNSDGLLVAKRSYLRKRQLKAFNLLCQSTHVSVLSKKARVDTWNSLDASVRNHPELVAMAIKSAPYYRPGSIVNYTSSNVSTRVKMMLVAKQVKLKPLKGEHKQSLFDFIVYNARFIQAHYRYDSINFLEYLSGSQRVQSNIAPDDGFDVKDIKSEIINQWESIRHVASMADRIRHTRAELQREYDENRQRWNGYTSMRDRLNAEYDRIYQTRPIHWAQSLNDFQSRIANRIRPMGACVGIELEFVGSKHSDIATWSDEDFPQETWHSFKHDGSIGQHHDDEVVPAFQEYTCFINNHDNSDWTKVRNVLKSLTNAGAIVNNSCGNHVHIDMRHKSQASYYRVAGALRTAFNNWAHRMVSHRRCYSRYCGIQNDHHNNRYTAINTQCWNEHRTLEVRIGMPTLNFSKLYLWTQFLKYLADNHTRIETFDEFMQGDAPMHIKLYVLKRIDTFSSTYTAANIQPLPNLAHYQQQLEQVQHIGTEYLSQHFQGRM